MLYTSFLSIGLYLIENCIKIALFRIQRWPFLVQLGTRRKKFKGHLIQLLAISKNQYQQVPTQIAWSRHKCDTIMFHFLKNWGFDTVILHRVSEIFLAKPHRHTIFGYKVIFLLWCLFCICDMIKGNESLVENFNFLALLSHNFSMLHFDANPITMGYMLTELWIICCQC